MHARSLFIPGMVILLLLPVRAERLHGQDGFLFSRPTTQATLRAGAVVPRAEGDLFDFITSELSLERSDFRAPWVGVEVASAVHPRVDLMLGLAWSESASGSEFREWVGEDDEPIAQVTRLRTVPLTVSARLYPFSRGRAVGSLAWLPARVTPYVGGGAGVTWYRLRQVGEFVSEDEWIFEDDFTSSGYALGLHALAGLEHWLTPRLALNVEGRYGWASAVPEDDFRSWDSLDLSGVQAGIGLSVRW